MTNKYMYFIANWKMFGGLNSLNSLHKIVKFFKTFKKNNSIKIIYCPPNILIRPMSKKLKNSKVLIFHHDFFRTDQELDEILSNVLSKSNNLSVCKELSEFKFQ